MIPAAVGEGAALPDGHPRGAWLPRLPAGLLGNTWFAACTGCRHTSAADDVRCDRSNRSDAVRNEPTPRPCVRRTSDGQQALRLRPRSRCCLTRTETPSPHRSDGYRHRGETPSAGLDRSAWHRMVPAAVTRTEAEN